MLKRSDNSDFGFPKSSETLSKKAIVIGAGFGGLAAALAAGVGIDASQSGAITSAMKFWLLAVVRCLLLCVTLFYSSLYRDCSEV